MKEIVFDVEYFIFTNQVAHAIDTDEGYIMYVGIASIYLCSCSRLKVGGTLKEQYDGNRTVK